jgi:hypothetical protein
MRDVSAFTRVHSRSKTGVDAEQAGDRPENRDENLSRAQVAIDEWRGIFQNMSPAIKELFEQVASWPEEDQEELAELARQIEARRTGIYRATPEELRTLDKAERSGIASDEEVEAAFRSFRHQ